MSTDFLWVEKYRPKKIAQCFLPHELKHYFVSMVERGEIQNMLLNGPSGSGKTTVARALCEELNSDYILINGKNCPISLF